MNTRRDFLKSAAAFAVPSLVNAARAADSFRLNYVLSSAMYGEMALEDILPEVHRTGCEAIDIWCRVHGIHLEQI